MKLTIIRGIPGSGKSTYAEVLAKETDATICEADQYFVNDKGVYEFDATQLGKAHDACKAKFDAAVCAGRPVIVSNTCGEEWEMQYYVDRAELHGIVIEIISLKGRWESIHNIPKATMAKLKGNNTRGNHCKLVKKYGVKPRVILESPWTGGFSFL